MVQADRRSMRGRFFVVVVILKYSLQRKYKETHVPLHYNSALAMTIVMCNANFCGSANF